MEETTFEDLLKRFNLENRSAIFSDDPEKIERQGFVVGSLVKAGSVALKGFIAEAIDDAAGGTRGGPATGGHHSG